MTTLGLETDGSRFGLVGSFAGTFWSTESASAIPASVSEYVFRPAFERVALRRLELV